LTEETWKRYARSVREYRPEFSERAQQDMAARLQLNGERPIQHPNLELNFNLPVDLGGLGHLFNRSRYSRVCG
jgi:hypothetical protein